MVGWGGVDLVFAVLLVLVVVHVFVILSTSSSVVGESWWTLVVSPLVAWVFSITWIRRILRRWVPFIWSFISASIVSLVFTVIWPSSSWTPGWTHLSTALSWTTWSAAALSVALVIHWAMVPLDTLRFARGRWIVLWVALVFFALRLVGSWWNAWWRFLWWISSS